jgi:hypothetical protein
MFVVKKNQPHGSPQDREARRLEKRGEMFKKMAAGMEAMPDDFPPVVMFNNIAAIRENSDRILKLLEKDRSTTEEPTA